MEAITYFEEEKPRFGGENTQAHGGGTVIGGGEPPTPAAPMNAARTHQTVRENYAPGLLRGQQPLGDSEQYRHVDPLVPETPRSETVVGADGKGRTKYGGYVRVVDQETGAVTWEDGEGNAVAAPKSMQMMDAMNDGYSPNRGTARNWDDAIKQQNGERVAKANAYAQRMILSNRQAKELRARRVAKQNAMTGDLIGAALADLNENLGAVQETQRKNKENIRDYTGLGSYSGQEVAETGGKVHKGKDGNFYVRGIVRREALDGFNQEAGKLGARDMADKIVASQRVDAFGNPIGEPTFSVLYNKNALVRDGEGLYAKTLTLGQAVDSVYRAQVAMGMPELDAKNYATRQFGANPFNWKLEEAAPASVQAAQIRADGARDVQALKNEGFAKTQGMKNEGARDVARINAESRRQVEEIRQRLARPGGGRASREATANDAKRLSEIVGDLRLDEETRGAAKEALNNILGFLSQGGGDAAPVQGGGEGKPRYKAGDKIEKDSKKYELYTGDDGKLHARHVK